MEYNQEFTQAPTLSGKPILTAKCGILGFEAFPLSWSTYCALPQIRSISISSVVKVLRHAVLPSLQDAYF